MEETYETQYEKANQGAPDLGGTTIDPDGAAAGGTGTDPDETNNPDTDTQTTPDGCL